MLESIIIEKKFKSVYLYNISFYSQLLADAILRYGEVKIEGFLVQMQPDRFFHLAKSGRLLLSETVLRCLVMDEDGSVFFEGIPVIYYKCMRDDFCGYILYPDDVESRVYDKFFSERQKENTHFINVKQESVLIDSIVVKNKLMEHNVEVDESASYLVLKGMKILNPWKLDVKEYIQYGASFFFESYDLLFPSLFNDYANISEGPYEFDAVQLEEGDMVFDCGANIGIFSSYALFKGCDVRAFEPMPTEQAFLEQNMKGYKGGEIVSVAVSNESGQCTMKISEQSGATASMNLMDEDGKEKPVLPWSEEPDKELKVDMMTIDEYVVKEGINRVDFIKADIEGAERYMLMGAKKVLQQFSPKLAICTYHLKDDKEILERLILEANPNYIVMHKWKKLFAYVPEKNNL